MENMIHPPQDMCERWFRHLKIGDFDTRQEGRAGRWKAAKKFGDVELQGSLNEADSQTQKQLTEQLDVSQKSVFNPVP